MKSNLVFGLILFSAVQTLAVASPVMGQILSSEEAETAKLNISIQKSNAGADRPPLSGPVAMLVYERRLR